MNRLVIVSNRLPTLDRSGSVEEPEVPVGGLASALLTALRRAPGGIWFGWNGRVADTSRPLSTAHQTVGGIDFLGVPLTREELEGYYLGFCNETLWPLFHGFQDRVRVRLGQETAYRHLQARFASTLLPLLRDEDVVWVHDYHMLLLGQELRRRGWRGRIGFFLHVPFPPYELWQILPDPRGTLEALLEYDVVGFHIRGFLDNYLHCLRRELHTQPRDGDISVAGRKQHVGVYPAGIDPGEFMPSADVAKHAARPVLRRMLRGRRLILGVDRLDYTKGIPEKVLGFERFIERYPDWRKRICLVQIAAPSRTEAPDYVKQRGTIESLMGRINGEMGEHDWTPLSYLYRTYPRKFLARLYRDADIGLVTPLRDGMNLGAKEFVAAQNPESPGVLVLSRCSGAAERLKEALIVNPYDPEDVAEGIARALAMPLAERRDRHAALLARIVTVNAVAWGERFVEDLREPDVSAPSVPDMTPHISISQRMEMAWRRTEV